MRGELVSAVCKRRAWMYIRAKLGVSDDVDDFVNDADGGNNNNGRNNVGADD